MLTPRDTPTRERKSLDGLWRFALDPGGVGRGERWYDAMSARAREIPVPASATTTSSPRRPCATT